MGQTFSGESLMRRIIIGCLVACPVIALAQSPERAAPASAERTSRQSADSSASTGLAVRRVILYKTGVGYFEHLGAVRDRQNVTVRFTSAQLNDVLKSLTVLDLGKGQITGISYNSVAPLEQRLGALRLPLDESTTAREMLASLRGARVEVSAAGAVVEGRLLGMEQRTIQHGSETTTVDVLSLMTEAGELRTFDLTPAVRVRIVERDLRQEVGRYLDLVGSSREQDVRNMVISTSGSGERQLFVSYISEVPIWKSTYRLVLPSQGKPFLQGWAIVDNTIGEDWRDVELSLVAGAPQSFIQNISQPYYAQRPVVPMPSMVLMSPQTHQGAFGEGAGTVSGTVRDPAGAVLPGVTVRLVGASGVAGSTVTAADGRYALTAPAGLYTLRFELTGFTPRAYDNWTVQAGMQRPLDVTMQVGGLSESVAVTADRVGRTGFRGGVAGGVSGGVVSGLPAPPPPPPPPAVPRANVYDQIRDAGASADAATLADLFEYRIKEPITLRKNQSALVPIVGADVTVDKVSLWNRGAGSGRPVRAVWLTNATGLTLDGGSMTIVDGNAFAGEGLVDPLKAGERRLISYATDLGVMVDARRQTGDSRVFKVRARDGVIVQETEERATWTYRARNENTAPTTLIVEHRLPSGWKLAEGQTPAESTTDAQRFRVVLPVAKETVLDVREVRQGQSSVMISNIDDLVLTRLVQSGVQASALEAALRPIITKKTEVAALERQLQSLQAEAITIAQDQQRLRENMKALRGSAEEKQLLQRYTRQLDEQETRLDTLKQDVTKTSQQLDKARGELSALIGSVSFELNAAPQSGR
jgi:hypothetical protein